MSLPVSADCVEETCHGRPVESGGPCVLHGGLDALLTQIDAGHPLRLTHFEYLRISATVIASVLDRARAARTPLLELGLRGCRVDTNVEIVNLTIAGTVDVSHMEGEGLRISDVHAASIVAGHTAFRRTAVLGHLGISDRVRIHDIACGGGFIMREIRATNLELAGCAAGSIEIDDVIADRRVRIENLSAKATIALSRMTAGAAVEISGMTSERDVSTLDVSAPVVAITDVNAVRHAIVERVSCASSVRVAGVRGQLIRLGNVTSPSGRLSDIHGDLLEIEAVSGGRWTLEELHDCAVNMQDLDLVALRVNRVDAGDVTVTRIHAPEIRVDGVRSSGTVTMDDVRADQVSIDGLTGGWIHLSDVQTDRLSLTTSEGSSEVRLTGVASARCDIAVRTPSLVFGASQLGGGRVALHGESLSATDCRLAGGLQLSPAREWVGGVGRPPSARILSLERSDLAGLRIMGLDLTECRFRDATGLSDATITTECGWATLKPGKHSAARVMLFDDARAHSRGVGLDAPASDAELIDMYRAARSSVERGGDESRARDLYYGEMEVRRAHATSLSERAVLFGYWIGSGYGERPWRPLALLAVLLCLGLAPLHHASRPAGLPKTGASKSSSAGAAGRRQDGPTVLALAASEVLAVGRINAPTPVVKATGQTGGFILGFLRLVGPVLIVLSLISVRRRTSR